jgi:hypothetical protein
MVLTRSSRKRAWEDLQELRWVLLDSAGMKLPPPAREDGPTWKVKLNQRGSSESHGSDYAQACAKCFLSFSCRNGMVVESKVARRFQTQIDELKRTNRNTAPTREKILAQIESELNSVYQYMDDLKDGLRRHSGEGVSYYIANVEALIELLEIHHCGSIGGFDVEAGGDSLHGLLYLEQRFEALKRKYASKLTPKKKSRGT